MPVFFRHGAPAEDFGFDHRAGLDRMREIKERGCIGYVAERELKTLSPPVFGCGQPVC
jgi:hypothetical protein